MPVTQLQTGTALAPTLGISALRRKSDGYLAWPTDASLPDGQAPGKLKLIIIIAVASAGGGPSVGGTWFFLSKNAKPAEAEAHAEEAVVGQEAGGVRNPRAGVRRQLQSESTASVTFR